MRGALGVLAACLLTACSRPVPAPVAQPARPPARPSLESADALIRAGCLDCLTAAFGQYQGLVDDAVLGADARRGAITAGVLIAMRERELGIEESGALGRARTLAEETLDVPPDLRLAFDVYDTLPLRFSATNR